MKMPKKVQKNNRVGGGGLVGSKVGGEWVMCSIGDVNQE